MRFSTVALGVADPDVSTRFYVEGLGLVVDSRPQPDLVYLRTGETRIALFPADRLAAYAGAEPRSPGSVVLALNVDRADEVDRRFRQACAAGGSPLRDPGRLDWGGWGATLSDPDGHVWELVFAPGPQSTAKS